MIEFLKAEARSGSEAFHDRGVAAGFELREFWSWGLSDLVGNTARGWLAEFIVAKALAVSTTRVRQEWAATDLTTADGLKIEVKSAAYVQSWSQTRLSAVQFGVKPTKGWNPETNASAPLASRSADIYVFALLAHRDKRSIDPLNLDQWRFFVLSTATVNEHCGRQKTISLGPLERIAGAPVEFGGIAAAVRRALDSGTARAPA